MIPLIRWELRQHKTYLFWWTLSMVLVVAMLVLIYPSIRDQAEQLNKAIRQLPEAIRDLKGGGGQIDIASPVGFLHSQVFYITLPLMQIIMSIGLGSSLLARDEQDHTLELLLARPVSRAKLAAGKAVSGIAIVGIASLAATVTILVLARVVGIHISIKNLVLANLFSAVFSMSFGVIAFTLTALSSRTRRASIAVSVAISFGGYLLASLSSLSSYIENPAKLLPYHYYNPDKILAGQLSAGLIIYLLGVLLLGAALSVYGFRNRDIA